MGKPKLRTEVGTSQVWETCPKTDSNRKGGYRYMLGDELFRLGLL